MLTTVLAAARQTRLSPIGTCKRALCLVAWLAACVSFPTLQSPAAAASETRLALAGARIFDGTGAALRDGVILIRGERIAAIGPREQITLPDDARVIDLSGHWIIPGLIDAHVHFFQSGGLYTRSDIIDLRRFRPHAREIAWTRNQLRATWRVASPRSSTWRARSGCWRCAT